MLLQINSGLALKQTIRYAAACLRCVAPRLGIYLQLSLKTRSRVSEMCGCLTETRGRLFFTASLQGESETRILKSLVSILLPMAKKHL